jgi:hypothetical protein
MKVTQPLKKFYALHGTQSFITVLTTATGLYPEPDKSSLHFPNLLKIYYPPIYA